MKENILKVKQDIFYRAKIFIEKIGSFAPFASTYDGEVKDLMAYENFEESIEGMKLVNMLKSDISKDLRSDLIQIGAIAYDVKISLKNADGVSQKRDALCLIISTDGENWSQEYFPYMIIDGQCIWR